MGDRALSILYVVLAGVTTVEEFTRILLWQVRPELAHIHSRLRLRHSLTVSLTLASVGFSFTPQSTSA